MSTATAKKSVTAVSAALTAPTVLTLTFGNGQSMQVDAARLSDDIRTQAMMHGLKQKLIDAAAIARNPETGMTATLQDKYDAVAEVFDRITHPTAATWNKVRGNGEGNGNGSTKGGLLAKAMMRLTAKTHAAVMEYLDGMTKEQLAALRKNPRVIEMIATIQAESTKTTGVDSDALLDGLMGSGSDDGDDNSDAVADGDDEPASAPAPKAKRAPKPKAE